MISFSHIHRKTLAKFIQKMYTYIYCKSRLSDYYIPRHQYEIRINLFYTAYKLLVVLSKFRIVEIWYHDYPGFFSYSPVMQLIIWKRDSSVFAVTLYQNINKRYNA